MPRSRGTGSALPVVTTAETVVATLPPFDTLPSDPVDLEGTVDLTVGTAGTTVTVRIERGAAVGGTAVATFGPFQVTAGNRVQFTINATDAQVGEQASEQYVMTVQVAAATGNSTVNNAYLGALW